MEGKMQAGPPSPVVMGQPDLQANRDLPDPPALPAHPEWVEIVVPWGQQAPLVVQGQMALPGPRANPDPRVSPEHPVCPVHLVKWARPALPESPAVLTESKDLPALPDLPGLPVQKVQKVLPALPDLPVMSAQEVRQAHLDQLARMVSPEQLDHLVRLVQQAR